MILTYASSVFMRACSLPSQSSSAYKPIVLVSGVRKRTQTNRRARSRIKRSRTCEWGILNRTSVLNAAPRSGSSTVSSNCIRSSSRGMRSLAHARHCRPANTTGHSLRLGVHSRDAKHLLRRIVRPAVEYHPVEPELVPACTAVAVEVPADDTPPLRR